MNLVLLEEADFLGQGDKVRLTGRRLQHVREVHRAQIGDSLRVGLLGGKMGEAEIVGLGDDSLELRVQLIAEPPPPLNLNLFLALPRPKFLKRILQTVTSLGVKQIYLFNSYRVEKVYWSTEQVKPEAIREACLLGLEQARDTVLPEVHLRRRFKPFFEDEVPHLVKGTRALVAHPVAQVSCPYDLKEPITLAIGPEGGFIDYEIDHMQKAGFEVVRLTERILKVETAITTLIGRLT